MLTRRSFIGAASAALSLVGIKLPQAKAKTLVSIPGPTQPQEIIGSYEPSEQKLLIRAAFNHLAEYQFVSPHRYALRGFTVYNDGSPVSVNIGRQFGSPVVQLMAGFSESWYASPGRELIFNAGESIAIWSDRTGRHEVTACLERV